MIAQVQARGATSQISLRALPARKESSSCCYGRLGMQLFAMNRVFGLYASSRRAWMALLPRSHKNAPRVVNITPAMDA